MTLMYQLTIENIVENRAVAHEQLALFPVIVNESKVTYAVND